MPSTSAAVSPQARSTAVHASAANDAWLRPELRATNPVVAAPAKATRSFIGLRLLITTALPSVRRNTGSGVPDRLDPVEDDPVADGDGRRWASRRPCW